MKIISKYKDYYDYLGQIYGIDNKIFYKREQKVIEEIPKEIREKYFEEFYPNSKNSLKKSVSLRFKSIWFCNQRYPFLVVSYQTYYGISSKELNYFSYEAFEKEWKPLLNYSSYKEKTIKEHFQDNGVIDVNTKFESPQILIGGGEMQLDIILKHYNFVNLVSPEQAFQRVSMFISAKPEPPQTVPTDMHRFEAKGFDKKTSFRNM